MMVALVDDGDAHRSAREFLSGGQPTEAGPDDDDMVRAHISRSLRKPLRRIQRDRLASMRRCVGRWVFQIRRGTAMSVSVTTIDRIALIRMMRPERRNA